MKLKLASVMLLLLAAACNQSRGPGGPGSAKPDEAGGDGGAVMGSCAEQYGAQTLAKKQFAFDGELVGIKPSSGEHEEGHERDGTDAEFGTLTFEVKQWFKGGDSERIELKSSVPVDAVSSVDSPVLEKGSRYLVSGEDGFMHSCGFSRAWSEDAAAEWKATFSAG